MQDWQKRMEHERAKRDALALCNDKDLKSFTKDTDGSLEIYNPMPYKYDGRTYWTHMKKHAHTDTQYERCDCNRK